MALENIINQFGANGGFNPLIMGIQFGTGALNRLAAGEDIGNAALESLPLIGGIFSNLRAKRDRKQMEFDQGVQQQNANANFGNIQASNLPLAMGGDIDNINNIIDLNKGRRLNPLNTNDMYTKFLAGGTHEQNPNGGIPLGNTMNTVEEGEIKFKFDDGDYVFSNRLKY